MEARIFPAAALLAAVVSLIPAVSSAAGYRSANFIVRRERKIWPRRSAKLPKLIAANWLKNGSGSRCRIGRGLARFVPRWPQIWGPAAPTSFVFDRGEVFGWDMKIQGSEARSR